jgi:hypothetical protein
MRRIANDIPVHACGNVLWRHLRQKNIIHHVTENNMQKPARNTVCLWYDGGAEAAARFYAKTFPDSSVGAVHAAPGDYPSGK